MRMKRRWRVRESGCEGALDGSPYPPLVRRVLEARGIAGAAEARAFFDGPPEAAVPALPDLDKAVARLAEAARAGETVAVFGDFDVDGLTAAAILIEALAALGANVISYVPDRFLEGYGLNKEAISRLHGEGATLLLAVDCGTSSVDEVAHARSLDMDVVIVDHHLPPALLPDALAIVNPKVDAASPHAGLASAGLAYYLACALCDALGRPSPRARCLDLAALGTVVDMAPLTGLNRDLARRGVEALRRTERCGLQALMEVARVDASTLDTEALSFMLGPRLNAAGRVAHARHGLELLLCQDRARAWKLARELDALNRERQRQQAAALEVARRLLDEQDAAEPLVMLGSEAIAPGVAGLVASRLAEELYRPCVVYSPDGTISRASARSIEEFDIAAALRECGDLFLRSGGHRQAGGFTAENERLPEIRERLVACVRERLAGLELTPVIEIDAVAPLGEVGGEEIRWLSRMAPHGVGNPEPVFWSRGVTVVEGRTVGADDQHLRLKLKDGRVVWPAIGFGLGDAPVRAGSKVDIVYSIGSDRGGYGSLQLLLHDLAISS